MRTTRRAARGPTAAVAAQRHRSALRNPNSSISRQHMAERCRAAEQQSEAEQRGEAFDSEEEREKLRMLKAEQAKQRMKKMKMARIIRIGSTDRNNCIRKP